MAKRWRKNRHRLPRLQRVVWLHGRRVAGVQQRVRPHRVSGVALQCSRHTKLRKAAAELELFSVRTIDVPVLLNRVKKLLGHLSKCGRCEAMTVRCCTQFLVSSLRWRGTGCGKNSPTSRCRLPQSFLGTGDVGRGVTWQVLLVSFNLTRTALPERQSRSPAKFSELMPPLTGSVHRCGTGASSVHCRLYAGAIRKPAAPCRPLIMTIAA